MRNLKLIIKREYFARVKNKSFVLMTFLSPVILVGMFVFIAYLTSLNSSGTTIVAVHDETGLFFDHFLNTSEVNFQDFSEISLQDATAIVHKRNYTGLLHIPADINDKAMENIRFFAKEVPDLGFLGQLEKIISEKLTDRKLKAMGVNLSAIEEAEVSVDIQMENFSGERTSKMSNYVKMFFGGIAGYLLMMFIIIYGNMVMRSVIEEKTNRIIEIIISSVKPIHLMLGKILGTSLAGITQFVIWVTLGSFLLFAVSTVIGVDLSGMQGGQQAIEQISNNDIQQLIIDIRKLPLLTLVLMFLLYFISGYFLYSSIYAAIGAAVDNETDTQQFMLPVVLPLILGIYVGFFSVIENPHGVVSTVFSMIPLTSPIVMLMRIPFGVSWWEVAISVSILFVTIAGVVWLAAKIYRVGILMYGKKPGYKELYKWLKY